MLKTVDLLSQYTLIVSTECNLRCDFCSLWQNSQSTSLAKHVNDIKDHTFFKKHPKTQLYNIIGGDPFLNEDLLFILHFLKQHRIKVRIWTNGLFPEPLWEKVLPYLNAVSLYTPHAESDRYRMTTGDDSFEEWKNNLEFLKTKPIHLSINVPVYEHNIDALPDIYELAYNEKIPMIIHPLPNAQLSKESKRYLKRFLNIQHVSVLPHFSMTTGCPAVPNRASTQSIQHWRWVLNETWQQFWNQITPYYWLKKKFG